MYVAIERFRHLSRHMCPDVFSRKIVVAKTIARNLFEWFFNIIKCAKLGQCEIMARFPALPLYARVFISNYLSHNIADNVQ